MINFTGIAESDLLKAIPPGLSSGLSHTAGRREATLWAVISREFELFVAGGGDCSAYADVRRNWNAVKQAGASAAVGAVAQVMSVRLGLRATLLAPFIACLLARAMRTRAN